MNSSNQQDNPVVLIRRAKDGDTEAFGLLYTIYFTPVFRYIYSRVKDKETTNDLTQTVFLKVFQSLERYQEKNKSPLAYFFTVARNTVISYWRKKKEVLINDSERPLEVSAVDNPSKWAEKTDISKILYRAIGQLTYTEQEVIIFKFIDDLSTREIAKILGKTEGAIRQIQCRALKKLREYLKEFKII